MKKSRQKYIRLLAGMLLLEFTPSLHAASIEWKFEATITEDVASTDPLNINGESVTISLTFDDTNQWQQIGSYLYIPSVSSNAQITGGHTVSLNTVSPSGVHYSGFVGITEEVGVGHWMDLIIDGTLTRGISFTGNSLSIPSAGDNLLMSHLPSTFSTIAGISDDSNGAGKDYTYTDIQLTTITAIPITPALYLFGSGLLGLIGISRRKKVA